MASWHEAEVQCPFYESDNDNDKQIVCESMNIDIKSNKHQFPSRRLKEDYLQRYCCQQYKRCSYFKALDYIKYGD